MEKETNPILGHLLFNKKHEKKGISTVITTLIIILLGLIAIIIMWVVLGNMIREDSERIRLDAFTTNLEIQKTSFQGDNVTISLKRNPGKAEITHLKFIVSDGVNTIIIDKEINEFKELEIKNIALNADDLEDLAFVQTISIFPVVKKGNKETIGMELDKITFTPEQILRNMGVVAWWRFEENAFDSIGTNHGNIYGVDCTVEGKFGNACNFTGGGNPSSTNASYIEIPSSESINGLNEFTYLAWIKPEKFNTQSLHNQIMGKSVHAGGEGRAQMGMWINPESYQGWWAPGTIHGRAETSIGRLEREGPIAELNTWHHIALVFSENNLDIYLDSETAGIELRLNGTPRDPETISPTQLVQTNDPLRIGCGYGRCGFDSSANQDYRWFGLIDEVIILERAITQKQVNALYNLDLFI